MLNLMATAVTYLPLDALAAAPPDAASGINTQKIVSWVVSNIVVLVIMGIGLMIIMGARKGDYSKVLSTVGIVVIGLGLIGGVTYLRGLGDFFAKLVAG